ncbi:MAG: TonB C-terminal domain-containing protein [Campylobacterota bacterium]|nr:TonB C-terminal domain-containing protein [Campylobacterota bacterium]
MKNHFKILSGILAFIVYFTVLGLLLNYFNHRTDKKSVHYVKKNDDRIEVSLGSPAKKTAVKKRVEKPKDTPKSKPKPKTTKKANSVKADKDKKTEKSKKKVKMSNLFANVKEKKPAKSDEAEKKAAAKAEEEKKRSASKRISDSFKNVKSSDRGIKNVYFAKIEEVLQSWPAQSDFAGETVKVWLKIRKDGTFDFKILSASNNEDFNISLILYLEQLQKVGFESHQSTKPYELNVEFIAKE